MGLEGVRHDCAWAGDCQDRVRAARLSLRGWCLRNGSGWYQPGKNGGDKDDDSFQFRKKRFNNHVIEIGKKKTI